MEFTQTLSDRSVTESKEAIFECNVGHDSLNGKWFKDGEAIEACSRYQFIKDSCWHRLCIKDVTKEDNGLFVFQLASVSTSAWLHVNGKCNAFGQIE